MSTKFTPAPWSWKTGTHQSLATLETESHCLVGKGRQLIANLSSDYDDNTEEVEANAALIASAPDLLAVIMEMDKYLDVSKLEQIGHNSIFHTQMKKAIRKALGEVE